jgi:hypothetical protein
MKCKDKNGCIFIPTSKFTEEEMKKSKYYELVEEKSKGKQSKVKLEEE